MMLYRAGVPNDDLFTLIAENVRKHEEVLGDIHSFIAANALGAERLLAFMDEYGMHDLRALAARGADARRERDARCDPCAAGRRLSFGDLEQPARRALHYPLKLTVQGDAIELDFDGAPPQLPQGGLNCTYSYTAAHATYPMKCILSPQVRSNAGCYRPFTVKAPEGSILNCDKPASVNLRTRVGWYIAPNIFRALADAAPAQVQAATGLPVAINIYGREANGIVYADHFFMGAGQGASQHGDGKSALLYPDLGRQHLGRADGSRAHRCWCWRNPSSPIPAAPANIAAAAACAPACASCTTMGCRRWHRSIRKASASRSRACIGGLPAAACAAWCSIRTAT